MTTSTTYKLHPGDLASFTGDTRQFSNFGPSEADEAHLDQGPTAQVSEQEDVGAHVSAPFAVGTLATPVDSLEGRDTQSTTDPDRDATFQWNGLFTPSFEVDLSLPIDFPDLFWFPDDTLQMRDDAEHLVAAGHDVENRQTRLDRSRERFVVTKRKQNPYSNSPFVYTFKQGRPIQLLAISEFLHDRSSWRRIDMFANSTYSGQPRDVGVDCRARDSISARIHGILFKALDKDYTPLIPHQFPPLGTLQCIFQAFQQNFATMYPIVHPTTLTESSFEKLRPYEDLGLFLSTIMALGCLMVPVQQAQAFSVELGYLIRTSIDDSAKRDETSLADIWTISSCVLITVLSAWSGVRRHFELAEAYHSTFTAVKGNMQEWLMT